MKKLLKLFVVAALAVCMTLCCVACGANYTPVTEDSVQEVAEKFAEKLDEEAIIGTKSETKREAGIGIFADFEASLSLDDVTMKGKTKDEAVVIASVEAADPTVAPVSKLSAKVKTENQLSITATSEQYDALVVKLDALLDNYGDILDEYVDLPIPASIVGIAGVLKPFLNKTVTANGEIAFVDGVAYLVGTSNTTGIKGEARLSADVKSAIGGQENYNAMLAFALENVFEKLDSATEEVEAQMLMRYISMIQQFGMKVSVDLGSYSVKIEATEDFNNNLKALLSFIGVQFGENDKLDFKTFAITINLNNAGKISSVKLELNVEVAMTVMELAIKGNVKGSLEVKSEGLSVSAPSGEFLNVTDAFVAVISSLYAR